MIDYIVDAANFILNFHKWIGWWNIVIIPVEIFLILSLVKAMRCDVNVALSESGGKDGIK